MKDKTKNTIINFLAAVIISIPSIIVGIAASLVWLIFLLPIIAICLVLGPFGIFILISMFGTFITMIVSAFSDHD